MASSRAAAKTALKEVRIESFLLCNFAQVEAGKLNILGGGWSEVNVKELPAPFGFAIAAKLSAPKAHSGVFEHLELRLSQDGLGEPIEVLPIDAASPDRESDNPEARSVEFLGVLFVTLEITRPGRIHVVLVSNGHDLAKTDFVVKPPPEKA